MIGKAFPGRGLELRIERGRGVIRATYIAFAHLVRFRPDRKRIGLVFTDPPESQNGSDGILKTLPISLHPVHLHLYHSELSDIEFTARWIAKMFRRFAYIYKTQSIPRDPPNPTEGYWSSPRGWPEVLHLARSYVNSEMLSSLNLSAAE